MKNFNPYVSQFTQIVALSRLNLDSLSQFYHFLTIILYGLGHRCRIGPAHDHTADLFLSQFCNCVYRYKIMGNLLCLVQGDQHTVVIIETDKDSDNVLKLRFQQLAMKCETKTRDNFFVNIVVSIQYCDSTDKASETLHKLNNIRSQLQVYDFDVIRACVPKLNLDDACGFKVVQTLIVDTEPDEAVQRAMSEIYAAARLRMVLRQKTGRILQVKSAEGVAQSKYLSGLHNTLPCQAIVDGLGDRVLGFWINVPGTIVKGVVDVVLVTRYFETMKENRNTFRSSAIFIPLGLGVLVGKDALVLMLTKTTWNETLVWTLTDGRMGKHSMNNSDGIWSFYEVEIELNGEDWTSVTTGLRDVITGQQQFLYFYYPP